MKWALALVVLAWSTSASAFLCTRTPNGGPSVFWSERDVVMRPNGGGQEVAAGTLVRVLERGAAAWTGPECSDIRLEVGASTLQEVVGFNWHAGSGDAINQNIVIFRNDTPGDDLDRWLHTLGALAITTVTFESSGGRLLDADIEINDVEFEFTTCDLEEASCVVEFDLENTLTHELGHVLGLDHPPDGDAGAVDATMYASANRGQIVKRDLGDDDVAGICTVYPLADPVPGECYGVGRPALSTVQFEQSLCAGSGGDVGPGGWAALLALATVLAGRSAHPETRRRRR